MSEGDVQYQVEGNEFLDCTFLVRVFGAFPKRESILVRAISQSPEMKTYKQLN